MGAAAFRLLEAPDDAGLAAAVTRLLAEQASSWPLLANGLRGLAEAQTRMVGEGPARVALRYIPHRMQSTTARVDAASVAARPCFLCGSNLPPEQKGVAFRDEWVALANPFPILANHLTVVHREHTPQRIAGRLGVFLDLARWLPASFVIYNGPECGASAPDHLHFQAADRSLFPIAAATPREGDRLVLDAPCRTIVVRDRDRTAVVAELERVIAALADAARPEPLLNLAASWHEGRFTAYVFPRAKHRPAVYHRGEILVSPAAIDLCGVLVTPRGEDYVSLDATRVGAIYDEVALSPESLTAVARRLGWHS